jgi:hypothetical protein
MQPLLPSERFSPGEGPSSSAIMPGNLAAMFLKTAGAALPVPPYRELASMAGELQMNCTASCVPAPPGIAAASPPGGGRFTIPGQEYGSAGHIP